ncbi:MAG: hypothetical protein JJU00_00320 [Opitutales bacterium]|nr:hypothetical protein [Opitutales bacterium]
MGSTPRRLSTFLAFALPAVLAAEITLPPVFSDHMVLQRDRAVKIWGQAPPGEAVAVRFGDREATARAGDDGGWTLYLGPLSASAEPRVLSVTGADGAGPAFHDVLVGEVWLASGQSNMEKPLGEMRGQKPTGNHEEEIAAADHPTLRLFQVPHKGEVKRPDVQMRWIPCTPESVDAIPFSAAAYFFGRELVRELDVPVGLIHSSYGGTMIEAWTPREAFLRDPRLEPLLEETYFAWVEGVQATELFESMIRPVLPFTLRGFLWYQGEANVMVADGEIYRAKKRALVEGWRRAWNDFGAPFYFVQLAPFNYSEREQFPEKLTPEALPHFWEVQATCTEIPYTGMIVTTDLAGNARDIHPTNKRDVGLRLAGLALAETYGRTGRTVHSPVFTEVEHHGGGRIALRFKHTGDGLRTRDSEAPSHFLIAGKDGVFVEAEAEIDGDRVLLHSPEVPRPRHARFAWQETANPNLVNSAGLPAVPFRTDTLPLLLTRD